ncbi:MAG: response regulator transcription factor [Anaerolineae bacterium]|jgi:DNA-binding NarL/FixJ family response regulator|nr:response regulator transcription factor [Anaerolineae bacterium]
MSKIRLAIVEDQTLVREGLASLLGLLPDIDVVGKAADGASALAQADIWNADVILMDIRMPGMNGVAATRQICACHPHTKVIMLTTFDDDEYIFESLRAGAAGYLLKDADPDHLAAAIRAVHAGRSMLDPAVTQKVVRRAVQAEPTTPVLTERLTPRERDVLQLLVQGATNSQIAEQLSLTPGTVKNHLSHIFDKLSARDRTDAVRLTLEWGLLNDGN